MGEIISLGKDEPWSGRGRRQRTARAGNRRFRRLSARRAHTKAPKKIDLPWETLRARERPGRARTEGSSVKVPAAASSKQTPVRGSRVH